MNAIQLYVSITGKEVPTSPTAHQEWRAEYVKWLERTIPPLFKDTCLDDNYIYKIVYDASEQWCVQGGHMKEKGFERHYTYFYSKSIADCLAWIEAKKRKLLL